MSGRLVRAWLRRAGLLALVPLVPLVQQRVDAHAFRGAVVDTLHIRSGKVLRAAFPGFEDVLADIYWLRTVQYFGGQRAFSAEKRFDLLEPLIDITVSLDPRREIVYRYGAIFLCEPWPTGKGDPHAGVALLERGVRALPASWRVRQDLGYYRYIFLNDAAGGAEVLMKAARLPGAPFYLETLAGAVLERGGERRTAQAVWRRMYEQAEGGFIKENALYHLQYLDGLDVIDVLAAAVEQFRQRHGRLPRDAAELEGGGVAPHLFRDPTGIPFDYDPASGRFWFARRSRAWRAS